MTIIFDNSDGDSHMNSVTSDLNIPFSDLTAHEKLMQQLMDVAAQCTVVTEKAKEVLTELENHNNDITAHPDIRSSMSESEVSTDKIDERVSQHNESETAHPTMMAEIKKLIADTTTIQRTVSTMISTHNTASTSHADIRSAINELTTKLGNINLTAVTDEIASIQEELTTLQKLTIDLQSVDARHDAAILNNATAIDSCQSMITDIYEDMADLTGGEFIRREEYNAYLMRVEGNEKTAELGYQVYEEGAPSLLKFSHNLGTYVPKAGTATFSLMGAAGSEPQNLVRYDVELGEGDFDISPKTGISDGTLLTLVTRGGTDYGDSIYFTVSATDTTTLKSVKKVICAMVPEPLDLNMVKCYGLPANVEPGLKYTFVIRNIADTGSGRFSYQIDPAASELIFNKSGIITTGTEVEMTVPISVGRDKELVFHVIVKDKYGEDQIKEVIVRSNPIPGAEGFEHNIPTVVVPGAKYNLRFKGIVSSNGVPATYGIENANDHLIFSKTEGILANENVELTISEDADRGQDYEFYILTKDENEVSLRIEAGFQINSLPDASMIISTLDKESAGGKTLEFTLTGGSDPEGRVIKYSIESQSSNLTFEKINSISDGETIRVTIPKVSERQTERFSVYAVDVFGEKSAEPKEFSLTINPIYVADRPFILSPQEGNIVNPAFTMTWSEFGYHIEI